MFVLILLEKPKLSFDLLSSKTRNENGCAWKEKMSVRKSLSLLVKLETSTSTLYKWLLCGFNLYVPSILCNFDYVTLGLSRVAGYIKNLGLVWSIELPYIDNLLI